MRRLRREQGSTIVEFSIVSVVAFLLMFGMADMAMIVFGNAVGSNAARDGARVGIINYENADVAGSPNNLAIVDAVKKRLAGNILNPAVTVVCRPANIDLSTTVACQPGFVALGRDIIEVKVTWTHKGSSPFVPTTSHSATARMVIGGAPELTSSTTAPSSTTTTTTPSSTTTTTAPPPVLTALTMWDDNRNGKVDTVRATFSGALNAGCTTGWTLTGNVPSGGVFSGVATVGTVATLTITEGAGAPDTAVGELKVVFSAPGGCNAIAFGATAPADKAGPAVVGITSANHAGGIAGQMEANDTLTVTFSEAVAGVPAGALTVTEDGNYPSDNLEITGITNGYVPTGGNYVSPDSKTAWFPGSSVAISADQKTLTITVGGTCTQDCSKLMPGSGPLEFVPANTLQDAAGNVAVGNGVTPAVNITLF